MVLIFLRTLRATFIAGVALPLSLIATFGVMWFAGFSLDNLSLMALTIGTGFVVDDAIVMIENIVRHMENGEPPLRAALRGASEIGFTVISLTMSLIAVFIPLLFMTGLVGRMFREFALTLTIAVVASAIVSLTLTPMMCGRLLRESDGESHGEGILTSRFTTGLSELIEGTVDLYHRSLVWVLRHQRETLIVTLITLAATIGLYVVMPKGFLPLAGHRPDHRGDGGRHRRLVRGDAAPAAPGRGRRPRRSGRHRRRLGAGRLPAQLHAQCRAHGDLAQDRAMTRHDLVGAIIARLQDKVAGIPGMTVYFQGVQDIQISTRVSRAQYQYTLVSTDRAEVLQWADTLTQTLRRSRGAARTSPPRRRKAARASMVQVDREQAGRLGVSMQSVTDTLNDAFGQRQISTIYGQANQYRVILEAQPRFQQDPSALSRMYVTGSVTSNGVVATVANTAVGTTNTNTTATPNSRQQQRPGSALGLRAFRADHGAARACAPGAVSRRHHQLRSGAGLRAVRRGLHHQQSRADDRHAAIGEWQLLRRRRRIRKLAVGRAVADPRRGDRHLHRARRTVRELHPSAHHSLDPAVGRRRRAAWR